jgi:hypothetical protein
VFDRFGYPWLWWWAIFALAFFTVGVQPIWAASVFAKCTYFLDVFAKTTSLSSVWTGLCHPTPGLLGLILAHRNHPYVSQLVVTNIAISRCIGYFSGVLLVERFILWDGPF